MQQGSVAAQDGQYIHLRINTVQFSFYGPLLVPGSELLTGPPDFGRRLRLDHGVLGITTIAEGTDASGAAGAAARRWEADELTLESDGPILAGLDGEALKFQSPLTLRILPKGLRALVPRGTRPGYVPPAVALAAELSGITLLAGYDQPN